MTSSILGAIMSTDGVVIDDVTHRTGVWWVKSSAFAVRILCDIAALLDKMLGY